MGWKGLPVTNTQAYWIHSSVQKKIKCCEYGPRDWIYNISYSLQLMNWPNKLNCYSWVESLASNKYSGLLAPFISWEENEVL